jgi:tungstate transport system ATP-binding protein
MINSENRITLKNINYGVNNKPFFKNLSTDISTNGITVILGPNGSGKTLLTKIIKGLIKPESGELSIKLNGTTPKTGYLSQNIIFLRRNVFNNLAYPLEIKGFNKKMINKRIEFLLKYFGFSSKKKISARNLSEGNKQYLSFIRTLVSEPNLLILDEPSSNLDTQFTKKVENFLIKERNRVKIIMVTHDLFQAKRLADEILFINDGEIIEVSTKNKFLKSKNKLIQKFLKEGVIY